MTKKRWFRFYIDPWFKGTFGLSPNEIATYLTVLCEMYDNDGIVALDLDVMSRRCGMRPSSFQKSLDALIAKRKLFMEAGFLTSKAVSEEIKSREKLREKSAETRKKLSENANENKPKPAKSAPYIEERIQNSLSSLDVEALQPRDPLPPNEASRRALEEYEKRRRQRSTKH